MSLIQGIPRPKGFVDKLGNLHGAWNAWFAQVLNILLCIGNSGTTAKRPVNNLWVGQDYFDTTLGKPVFVKSLGPPAVWVDATGAIV